MKKNIKNILIFIIPIIIFGLALLTFYPGILSYDSYTQWAQVQSGHITNSHPFLTTYVMLLLSKIYNSPVTVFVFQIILFSIIWTYLCSFLRRNFSYKKDLKYQIFYTVVICLFPIFFIYAITLWKDIIYSYVMLLISIVLLVGAKKNFKYNIFELIILGISISIATLYRHNAIIASVLIVITLIIMLAKKKNCFKAIFILIISIVSSYCFLSIPKNIYLYEDSGKGKGSSFIAQYSIYSLSTFYHYDIEFEKEDLELLNEILPEEVWKSNYDPYLINTLLFSESLDNDLLGRRSNDVVKIFLKYSLKYPQYFVLHYLQADSMLYNPAPLGSLYVFEFSDWNPYYSFDHNTDSKLPFLRKIVTGWINVTYNKPYILRVILYRPVYPFAISILLMMIMIKKKWIEKRYFVALTPMIYNTVSLLPINIAQDLRYVYINFLTFAMVLLLYITLKNKKKSVE